VSVAAIAWQQEVPAAWQFSRAFLPNKAQYFALGVVSAVVVREGWKSYWPVFAGVLVLCAAQGGIDKLLPPVAWTLCLAVQCSILPRPLREGAGGRGLGRGSIDPLSLSSPLRWVAAVLQSRSLVWLGAVSYCTYLVNEPVQKLLGVALAMLAHGDATLFTALWIPGAIILPILAAWWLHEWIELPAQRYGRDMALVNVQ
jgi:peptidoglycan/LPS O-acetylase OafA/YrhL